MTSKMRSIKAIQKRLVPKVSGNYKRWHANTSHLACSKTSKRKRHLRKSSFLSKSDWKRLRKVL